MLALWNTALVAMDPESEFDGKLLRLNTRQYKDESDDRFPKKSGMLPVSWL